MDIYVVYLTIYSGNKLPPFYIGSTSLDNISNGYRGSVKSKKYKSTWKQELRDNPHLFKTKIISKHDDRKQSLEKELILQQKLNVVKSPMYINMSLASIDGYFGMSTKGISKTSEMKHNLSKTKKGIPLSEFHKNSMRKPKNNTHNMSFHNNNSTKINCPYCGKQGQLTNMKRWHFDKCKYKK